jgi:hypothetical protein
MGHVLVDRDDVDAADSHRLQHGLQLVLVHGEVAIDHRLIVRACEGGPRVMNGGIVQRSTLTFTSSRGLLTLKTFSALLYVPLSPVTLSMVAVSIEGAAAWTPADSAATATAAPMRNMSYLLRMGC